MSETKAVQAAYLKMLKVFTDICEKHGLRYLAMNATCIGAVRHKGFVPWDIDVDVAMPYGDLIKFTEIAEGLRGNSLELYDTYGILPKITDRGTTAVEIPQKPYPETYSGLCIDVFPVAGVPENKFRIFTAMSYFAFICGFVKRVPFRFLWDVKARPNKKWLVTILAKPFLYLFPRSFFTNLKQKLYAEYEYGKWEYSKFITPSVRHRSLTLGRDFFEKFVYMDFEDIKIRCPNNYDEILTHMYGDYMTFPPHRQTKEQQEAVLYPYFYDFNRSYKEYQKTGELLPEKARERYLKKQSKKGAL